MSLWKLAKSIAKDTSEDVNEVYERLVKNGKKIRRMEGEVYWTKMNTQGDGEKVIKNI